MELKEIVTQAEIAEALMADIAYSEGLIQAKKTSLRTLLEDTIPSMLIEAGVSDLTLSSGAFVGMKQIFAVSMPAAGTIAKAKPERQAELFDRVNKCSQWLKDNGGADIINNQVVCDFSAGEEDAAAELASELRERQIALTITKSVHPGTLKSFLREKWNADTEIPVELFETYTGQVAEINLPKPVKSGK